MSQVLSISITPELIQALKDQAKEERRSVSEVAREALKRYLEAIAPSDRTVATDKAYPVRRSRIGNRKLNAGLKHD